MSANNREQDKKPEKVVVHVLSTPQYKKLEDEVASLTYGRAPRSDTTVIQAGVQIGVELVLRKLREGFVAG